MDKEISKQCLIKREREYIIRPWMPLKCLWHTLKSNKEQKVKIKID